jgi:hypothetical protein
MMRSDPELHVSFRLVSVIVLVGLVAGLALAWVVYSQQQIHNFEDCRAAGYPIVSTNPEQCVAKQQTFSRER